MSNILLKNLVDGPITPQMIVYVTQKATSVIPCDSMLSSLSSSSSSSSRLSNSNSNHTNNKSNNKNNNNNNKNNNNKNLNQSSSASSLSINTDNNHVHHIHHDEDLQLLPPLQNFIQRLVTRSSVSTATFLTTIIYLDRLKKKLPKLARGMHCTRHRVFLAILIVASKYLNDSSPRNKYWARFSSVYSVNKVNLMERQLLTLLDYDLRVTEAELLLHLSPFLKSPSLSTSYNNNSTGNTLIDTLKLPYPINSNLNNNNNGNLDNLDNHTINNSNEYIQRTHSYPQISIPKSLSLSMYDNDNNMNTINNNNNNNNVFSSPSSYQPLIIDNNNNYNYNDDNDDAMNTDEDYEFSPSTNNVNTVINDNSFSNFSQNIDQHQTKDQFGRRLSSTSTCSSSSTSSITTPTSVPTAFQNNSNNLLLQQQLNHLQLLQLQLNLFNKQPDIPSIPSIITPTSTNYLQSQHQLNQNSHSHHHHYQQQSSFQPPPLKSLLSDAGADNYFGSSDFNNNNNHNQIHHGHYNYNLPILNVNNNNNFHQHYNHIILPNPVNTTTTTNVSYME